MSSPATRVEISSVEESPEPPAPQRRRGPIAALLRIAIDLWRIHRDPVGWARSQGVRVGERCRLLSLRRFTFGSEPYLIRIGDHVTITRGVEFLTHDGGVWVFRDEQPDIDVFGPIVIGNNVFVGANTILMPGATIGDDCVIGAGSVVTGRIPEGCVAVGVPARPVRSRAEYHQRVQAKAVHIRSLSPELKRQRLVERFRSVLGDLRE